jgi:hypothetical protein
MAWGAYFAREHGDASADAAMLRIVDQWEAPKDASEPDALSQSDAMEEVLDALIQRKIAVRADRLSEMADRFPEQAAILAGRLSIDEAKPLLEGWYERRHELRHMTLARVAAMMLSKAPPTGFAASVLKEAAEQWSIFVYDPGTGGGSGGSSSCCGVALPQSVRNWPPLFEYWLDDHPDQANASLLVEAGGDRITYERGIAGEGFGKCPSVRPLDNQARHALLAEMLGVKSDGMAWKPWQRESFEWEGRAAFLSELETIMNREEAKLRSNVAELYDRGLLTAEEAGSVRPKLRFDVIDERALPTPDLATPESTDGRTSIAVSRYLP